MNKNRQFKKIIYYLSTLFLLSAFDYLIGEIINLNIEETS